MNKNKSDTVVNIVGMIMSFTLLVIVVGISGWWFSQLIGNLKDSRRQVEQSITHTMSTLTWGYGFRNDQDNGDAICKAYEVLDRELSSWLTILGLMGGMFGLIVPLVGFLLQHQKLKEEKDAVDKIIEDFTNDQHCKYEEQKRMMDKMIEDFKNDLRHNYSEQKKEIDNTIKEMRGRLRKYENQITEYARKTNEEVNDSQRQIRDMAFQTKEQLGKWKRQIIAFAEYSISEKFNHWMLSPPMVEPVAIIAMANLIIAFDYLLESLIRWNEGDRVKVCAKMHEWIEHVDTMWRKLSVDQQSKVHKHLRVSFKPSSEFALREDFIKILRVDSDDFKWLEAFFKPFAPWKFS